MVLREVLWAPLTKTKDRTDENRGGGNKRNGWEESQRKTFFRARKLVRGRSVAQMGGVGGSKSVRDAAPIRRRLS